MLGIVLIKKELKWHKRHLRSFMSSTKASASWITREKMLWSRKGLRAKRDRSTSIIERNPVLKLKESSNQWSFGKLECPAGVMENFNQLQQSLVIYALKIGVIGSQIKDSLQGLEQNSSRMHLPGQCQKLGVKSMNHILQG